MKSTAYAIALCAALLLSPCAAAEDAAPTPTASSSPTTEQSTSLQTAKQANLRKLPNRKSNMLAQLDKGTQVEVLSLLEDGSDTWAYVRVKKSGREGYVMMDLLEPIPTPTPVPTPSPTPTPSPVPTPTPTPKPTNTPKPTKEPTPSPVPELVYEEPRTGRTLMRANLRKTADGTRIMEVAKNERLTLIGEIEKNGKLWLHVKTEQGKEGYMLAELVRQLRPVVLLPVDESTVLEQFPVISCDPLADIKAAEPFTYTQEELAQYTTLREGDRSDEVLKLKRRLYEMGYYTKPNENTLYTSSTADVIENFQKDCGLPVTGEADPHTQAMLYDERTLKREGSPQEILYLDNKKDAPVYIQRAEVTSYSFYGSVQVSIKNLTGKKLTRFALKIIPYMSDGTPADMAETFAEEILKEYSIKGLSVRNGGSYSDFYTEYDHDDEENDWPEEDDWLYGGDDEEDDYVPEHHFQVSRQIYFSGAQIAVSWYRTGGANVYVDDDQLIFINVSKGAGDSLIHTLPIEVTEEERLNAGWEMGITSHYVLPIYQTYYGLPQGAWLESVEPGSPAEDAGLQAGDIINGINDLTILGDATLRKARGRMNPGDSATVTFWRDGQYYTTELIRPEEAE
ncbi:MAG: SH3 domain-containing protein [Clostridia bacterium]|nr:SH3 domain-containing protein [Clostridia bacterium]